MTVTDMAAHHGAHALLLNDASASSLPMLECSSAPQRGAMWTFWMKPDGLAHGFAADITGTTTTRTGVVFHLLFRNDGSIDWYDGSRWLPVASTGSVSLTRWSKVEVRVTSDQRMADVSVNGRWLGSAGPWGVDPVTSIDGFSFAGSGTPYIGDRVLLDDVTFGPAPAARPAAVLDSFHFGARHVITTSDQTVQMPNSAVLVPHTGSQAGQRILATYPAHTDSGTTAGNRLVYSDDGGKSWHDDQADNPMPGAPSFSMTRLRDGSIIAVNYHTYATNDPTRGIVETAVSDDGGHTWSRRDGTLNADASLAPYACERPSGCTAIVLVHNVIEMPDGTLLQSAYGRYEGDAVYRQLLLASVDGGLNWTVRATVAYDPNLSSSGAYQGFCEGVFTRDGQQGLIVVMRTGSYQPMYIARSDDAGRTWTTPRKISTPNGLPVMSVYPAMERLADGSLLLMVGRPGLSLLRSFDDGVTWSNPTWIDYTDSANGYMLNMGGRSVMIFGDQGANWQHPAQYGVWDQTVTVHGQ